MFAYQKTFTALAAAAFLTAGAQAETAAHATEPVGALSEMTLGDADAPVTVIEYASLTCSHCANWHEEVFPTVNEQYIETGKIRFILREMPVIPGHPTLVARSYAGAMLARCAADDGGADKYFSVMDTLFETQETWAFGEDARAELLKTAADAGIDEAAFDACLQRDDIKAHIDDNIAVARDEYEIGGTPSFIVNGVYKRFQSHQELFDAIDAATGD